MGLPTLILNNLGTANNKIGVAIFKIRPALLPIPVPMEIKSNMLKIIVNGRRYFTFVKSMLPKK